MLALALVVALEQSATQGPMTGGSWDAWLESPGGRVRFGLEFLIDEQGLMCVVSNADERIEVPEVTLAGDALVVSFEHYDSRIEATVSSDRRRLDGEWTKRSGVDRWTRLPFHASWPSGEARAATIEGIVGRWSVRFEREAEPAVAVFETLDRPVLRTFERPVGVQGAVLTTLGDYRYLSGSWNGVRLDLSTFDGAHAFLLTAEWKPNGTLEGDFWSGDSWHDTWTAVKDPNASLPDPFGLTKWNEAVQLEALEFPDLEGKPKKLSDPAFAGRARILQVFGSWCPNCNDEAELLRELDERYRERGLSIVGLAFELTGDTARDARQVKLYAARHRIAFPLLLAGTADKSEASKRLPLLDKVRAYPTTLFLHADGRVRAVHQGFCGPATGPEHLKLREDFERLIGELLAEGEPKK